MADMTVPRSVVENNFLPVWKWKTETLKRRLQRSELQERVMYCVTSSWTHSEHQSYSIALWEESLLLQDSRLNANPMPLWRMIQILDIQCTIALTSSNKDSGSENGNQTSRISTYIFDPWELHRSLCGLLWLPPTSCRFHVLWEQSNQHQMRSSLNFQVTDRQALLVVFEKRGTFICGPLSTEVFWVLSVQA